MTQSTIEIQDGTGEEVLQAFNAALQTLATNFQGASEPSATYASQFWTDTSGENPVLKQRNSDNTGWIEIGKFVDGKFVPTDKITVSVSEIELSKNWAGNEAPYTQEIEFKGMTENDVPTITLIPSGNYALQQSQKAEFAKCYRCTTSENKLTFYAREATAQVLSLQVQLIK